MAHQHSPGFLKLVEETKGRITEISAEDMKRKLDWTDTLHPDFHLIDVREAEEYAAGRIPGARHFCKGIIERDIETAIPDLNADVVLYCGGGFRSALAADNLQKMGYTRVRSLAGGWRGWLDANYPISKP